MTSFWRSFADESPPRGRSLVFHSDGFPSGGRVSIGQRVGDGRWAVSLGHWPKRRGEFKPEMWAELEPPGFWQHTKLWASPWTASPSPECNGTDWIRWLVPPEGIGDWHTTDFHAEVLARWRDADESSEDETVIYIPEIHQMGGDGRAVWSGSDEGDAEIAKAECDAKLRELGYHFLEEVAPPPGAKDDPSRLGPELSADLRLREIARSGACKASEYEKLRQWGLYRALLIPKDIDTSSRLKDWELTEPRPERCEGCGCWECDCRSHHQERFS